MRTLAAAVLALSVLPAPASGQELTFWGDPSPGGQTTLRVQNAPPGAPVQLVIAAGLLDPPLPIAVGTLAVDILTPPSFQLPLGATDGAGALEVVFDLPADPTLVGALAWMQAFAGTLTPPVGLWIREPALEVTSGVAGDRFGFHVAAADLDGDGLDDLVVGATGAAGGAGRVHIAYGPSTATSLLLDDPTPQDGGRFGGFAVVGRFLGDDDVPDVAVSAPFAGETSADGTGEVWVFEGPDFTNVVPVAPPGGETGMAFGAGLAAGDFDGDGVDDLAVGAPGSDAGGFDAVGKVHVYAGPAFAPIATLLAPVPQPEGVFGATLDAGDFDGDSLDDLVVGSPNATSGGTPAAGEVYVFAGRLTGPPAVLQDPHPSTTGAFGCRVLVADLVGDDRPDVLVGTPGGAGTPEGNPLGVELVGEIEVYDAAQPGAVLVREDPTPEFFQHFGMDVGAADVDGDGALDLLVAAFLSDTAGSNDAGELFVLPGPDFLAPIGFTAAQPEAGANYGFITTGADLDGDGREAVLVGAPLSDGDGADGAGVLYVYEF